MLLVLFNCEMPRRAKSFHINTSSSPRDPVQGLTSLQARKRRMTLTGTGIPVCPCYLQQPATGDNKGVVLIPQRCGWVVGLVNDNLKRKWGWGGDQSRVLGDSIIILLKEGEAAALHWERVRPGISPWPSPSSHYSTTGMDAIVCNLEMHSVHGAQDSEKCSESGLAIKNATHH